MKRYSPSITTLTKFAETVGCELEIKLTQKKRQVDISYLIKVIQITNPYVGLDRLVERVQVAPLSIRPQCAQKHPVATLFRVEWVQTTKSPIPLELMVP